MNIPVGEDQNSLAWRATACSPGDYVVLRAEMDCFAVFSSCPQDILPINGEDGQSPREATSRSSPDGGARTALPESRNPP